MLSARSLDWPFLDDSHRALATKLAQWIAREIAPLPHRETDVDTDCRQLVDRLGKGGWLKYTAPVSFGGARQDVDLRSLCLIREMLAYDWSLADFAFAMQGLGAAPIVWYGSDSLRRRYLPRIVGGQSVAAFALSELEAGSDVAAMRTTAHRDGQGFVVNGDKAWISNAGIADHYVVFTRFPEQGDKAFLALVVDADNPGLRISTRTAVMAPHPLGTVTFNDCWVAEDSIVGEAGKGLAVALGTLEVFRATVAAAAIGFARRALDEAVQYVQRRKAFGQLLSNFQLTQARIADMVTAVDAGELLVQRAGWAHDVRKSQGGPESAVAKLYTTESAQRVIDDAVQLFGGQGVVSGTTVERLYREIRALRIYEGTSEIQKLVIARHVFSPRVLAGSSHV
jgi:acyl-CoA dehydrogenase